MDNVDRKLLIVYGRDRYGQSLWLQHVLHERHIEHEWSDVVNGAPRYQADVRKLARGYLSVPTVIFPDGTVYVGDNFTYRTPSASAIVQLAKPQGKNVALISAGARIKGVSSNFGGGDLNSAYGANKAIDGDLNTEWSSDGDGDKAWIEIDLGKDYAITNIGFRTCTMGTSAQIQQFQAITDKGEKLGPFDLPDAKSVYYFPVSTTARTLRFEVLRSSGGNTGAAEIEVYASP